MNDIDKIISRNLLWQAKHICAALAVPQNREQIQQWAAYLNSVSKKFKENGLIFEIHPLFPSLVLNKNNITPLDALLRQIDSDILLQPDFFHIFMAKTDPVDFIEKYHGRIFEAHFKDCRILEGGLDMIPSYSFDVLKYFRLTPLGQGVIPWKKIIEACVKYGFEYCWAEQEEWEKDAFECIKESFDFLTACGLEV